MYTTKSRFYDSAYVNIYFTILKLRITPIGFSLDTMQLPIRLMIHDIQQIEATCLTSKTEIGIAIQDYDLP